MVPAGAAILVGKRSEELIRNTKTPAIFSIAGVVSF
jgi:hypothetical protein